MTWYDIRGADDADTNGWIEIVLKSSMTEGGAAIRLDEYGNLTSLGHFAVTGTPPSLAAAAGLGTSPPAPVLLAGSNDCAGDITFGSGTSPAAGKLLEVTFSVTWNILGGGNPHLIICPANAAAAALGLFINLAAVSASGFPVHCANAPAASQANTTYAFSYVVMG